MLKLGWQPFSSKTGTQQISIVKLFIWIVCFAVPVLYLHLVGVVSDMAHTVATEALLFGHKGGTKPVFVRIRVVVVIAARRQPVPREARWLRPLGDCSHLFPSIKSRRV